MHQIDSAVQKRQGWLPGRLPAGIQTELISSLVCLGVTGQAERQHVTLHTEIPPSLLQERDLARCSALPKNTLHISSQLDNMPYEVTIENELVSTCTGFCCLKIVQTQAEMYSAVWLPACNFLLLELWIQTDLV